MRINKYLQFKKVLLVITILLFSYAFSMWLFNDFKSINNFYYLRLIIPAIVIFICIVIGYKTICLSANCSAEYKKYYVVGVIALLFMLTITLTYYIKFPSIHFDTWQSFDTSKYVFSDFGRMDMIRQHVFNTKYETAFPPLQPFLMALINCLFNFGVFSSVVINFIICFLLFYYILKIAHHTKEIFIGLIISAFLMLNPQMVSCYVGGSTIPTGILFFVLTAYILITKKNQINIKRIIIVSIISGLGVLNRFDYIPIAIAIGILFVFLDKKLNVKMIMIYFTVFILTISPWILYSMLHFDSFFITDNGRRLINIPDTRPTTFFSTNNPALTLFDNPTLWFKESIKRWFSTIASLFSFISLYTYVKELLLIIVILIGTRLIKIEKGINWHTIKNNIYKNRVIYILFISLVLQTVAIILTGYSDSRYHILLSFFIFYIVLYFLSSYFNNKYKIKIFFGVLVFILAVCIIIPKTDMKLLENTTNMVDKLLFSNSVTTNSLVLSENLDVYAYLKNVNAPRMIINRNEDYELTMNIPKFSALCNEVTIMSPTNIDFNNVKDFVEFFNLNYLYSSDENQVDIFRGAMTVKPTEVEHLYKLVATE